MIAHISSGVPCCHIGGKVFFFCEKLCNSLPSMTRPGPITYKVYGPLFVRGCVFFGVCISMVGRWLFSMPHDRGCARLMGISFVGWIFNEERLLNNGSIVVFNGLLIESFPSAMGHVSRPVFQQWVSCFASWPMDPGFCTLHGLQMLTFN